MAKSLFLFWCSFGARAELDPSVGLLSLYQKSHKTLLFSLCAQSPMAPASNHSLELLGKRRFARRGKPVQPSRSSHTTTASGQRCCHEGGRRRRFARVCARERIGTRLPLNKKNLTFFSSSPLFFPSRPGRNRARTTPPAVRFVALLLVFCLNSLLRRLCHSWPFFVEAATLRAFCLHAESPCTQPCPIFKNKCWTICFQQHRC